MVEIEAIMVEIHFHAIGIPIRVMKMQ